MAEERVMNASLIGSSNSANCITSIAISSDVYAPIPTEAEDEATIVMHQNSY